MQIAKIDKRHVRKTDVQVTLTPHDIEEVSKLFSALKCLGGGLTPVGEEYTENTFVYMFDDMGFPVFSDRMGGVIGWFQMEVEFENIVFVPNKYVEVVR